MLLHVYEYVHSYISTKNENVYNPVECIYISNTFFAILYTSLALTIYCTFKYFPFSVGICRPALFMCSLFNDDVRGSDFIALNERMVCDCFIGRM
jgi:hypothetical protein